MKKLLPLLLLPFLVFIGFTSTTSASDLDVDLSCPTQVKVGETLSVTVYLENRGSNPINVQRVMRGLVANAGDTLMGIGVYGPFQMWLSSVITVPPGGTVPPFTVPIMTAPNVPGKIAAASVGFLSDDGKTIKGSGGCFVKINP